MYGTVARFRVKSGMEQKMKESFEDFRSANVPGSIGEIVYKMDSNPDEYYMAVFFKDKEAYVANAENPEQDARYRKMLEFMDGEPEWNDGEIVHARPM